MIEVQKVDNENKPRIVEHAESDVIKHVFLFYDVQYDPSHTTAYVAYRGNAILGYILIYTATDVLSVILETEEDAAETLITYAPQDHFIMHTTPNLLQAVEKRFPNAKSYVENWMLTKKNQAHLLSSESVRRLHTEEDAAMLAQLVLSRKDRPERDIQRYLDWVTRMPIYGVFKEDRLVSYAGSFIQLPQVWMIGGVYTDPEQRNRGYASLATSAVTKQALEEADAAALFVRSDNWPAIRVYEKIGYTKIGEKLWIDVGTGLMP